MAWDDVTVNGETVLGIQTRLRILSKQLQLSQPAAPAPATRPPGPQTVLAIATPEARDDFKNKVKRDDPFAVDESGHLMLARTATPRRVCLDCQGFHYGPCEFAKSDAPAWLKKLASEARLHSGTPGAFDSDGKFVAGARWQRHQRGYAFKHPN